MTRTPKWQILRQVNLLVVLWVFVKNTIVAWLVGGLGLVLLCSVLWGVGGGPWLPSYGWFYVRIGALLYGVYCAVSLVRTEVKNTLPYRRWAQGKCIYCGYDLTGNVSGVCPECGKPT